MIHIGSQELTEASHSVTSTDNISGVAASSATVFSKYIATASKQNSTTKFIVSTPIPRNILDTGANTTDVQFLNALRAGFISCLRANFMDYENVIVCTNENLFTAREGGGAENSKFYVDNDNLNSAGMKQLTRNWGAIMQKMTRTPDGSIFYRTSSSDSSSVTSSAGSCSMNSSTSSGSKKEPWKPY